MRNALIGAGTLAIAGLLWAGCGGGTQHLRAEGTQVSPGTEADIRIGKTEGSQQVRVDAQHLTPPDRYGGGFAQYAVWVVPDGGAPVLAGRLTYDDETRSGRMLGSTPYEHFEILVTAEPEHVGMYPSGPVVLRQRVD